MRILIVLVLLFTFLSLNAQPPVCPCGNCLLCPPPPPPNPVPISGIEILIGAGALLGVGKLVQRRKQNP